MQTNSSTYISNMFEIWKSNPSSVHESWNAYFLRITTKSPALASELGTLPNVFSKKVSLNDALNLKDAELLLTKHLKVQLLIRAFQVRGHALASLDPLGISATLTPREPIPELELDFYGLDSSDLNTNFHLGGLLPNFTNGNHHMKLGDILQHLKDIYCGTIGIEYMHIPSREKCNWLRERFEIPLRYSFDLEKKRLIAKRLIMADTFERFLHTKFPGEKRFGLEGCEAFIPGMQSLIDAAAIHGVDSVVIGMAHRGRLNLLSNVIEKPNESIFCEFNGDVDWSVEGSGDVKYHLGLNHIKKLPNGRKISISLVANPSHLEAVNPVVMGKVRGQQLLTNDATFDKNLAVLVHGDAAFSGQGVVYESLEMADLPNYTVGGTIHIVINNQIGFTTDPRFSRSTPYCTEIAKTVNAPIIHVNADDVEAVIYSFELAADWRKRFKSDVVIDLIGYRRYGHNEFDEPMFTQPTMYKRITKKQPVGEIYTEKLKIEGSITNQESENIKQEAHEFFEKSYERSKNYTPKSKEWLTSSWNGFKSPKELSETVCKEYVTGVPVEMIKKVADALCKTPAAFDVHRGIKRLLQSRQKMIESGTDIDMGLAEALAFGSLLLEGCHVRLSGQDVERGTFSHRHAILHDQSNEAQYVQLANIEPSRQAKFVVCNSSLCEFGVLGFEYGYSLVDPQSLVLWESQFGDFANNAQCIIDQFVASGERKWLQRTGLTLLLPHGYDGAGPEHSNGHIERFLALCDEDPARFPEYSPEKCRIMQDCNMQVVVPTTPANYFHVLRRQIKRDFRKPLVVFTSKSLLRHPQARSSIAQMTGDTRFIPFFPDESVAEAHASSITRLIFCSGQIYYALLREKQLKTLNHVGIARIEQLSPFPFNAVLAEVQRFGSSLREIVFAQEEAQNVGAWTHVAPRIATALAKSAQHIATPVEYAGRPPNAAIATGFKRQHEAEEQELLQQALFGRRTPQPKASFKNKLKPASY